jgi:hypothetical protein
LSPRRQKRIFKWRPHRGGLPSSTPRLHSSRSRTCCLSPSQGSLWSLPVSTSLARHALQALGLAPCLYDPGLYVYHDGPLVIFLIIYVDDLMLTSSHSTRMDWLQQQLCDQFAMSLLGPLSLYLGVDFFYNSSGILFSHSRYISRCLDELGLSACFPSPIPLDPAKFPLLSLHMDSPLLPISLVTYYRCGVGKLLHVTLSRPDISFAVGVVTRFTSTPREAHLDALIQIFQYLKGTSDLALHYQRGGDIEPSGYADSDFMGEKDTRRSTSGYLMNIGSAPTSWRSTLQNEVAQSSSEAEYRAVAEVTKEVMWYRNLFEDMGFPLSRPITIFCDNKSCIQMAKNPVFQGRTKHVERECHLTRDHVKKERISLEFVKSREQTADLLTKPLSKIPFLEMRGRLHLTTLQTFQGTSQIPFKSS